MSKEREALKLALEALKELRMLGMNAQWHDSWLAKPNEAITAIREALEQPSPVPEAHKQQEPVAFPNRHHVEREIERSVNHKGMHLNDAKERVTLPSGTLRFMLALIDRTSLPASKPWVGLVKEDWPLSPVCWTEDYKAGVAWAEAKLREKNAPQQSKEDA